MVSRPTCKPSYNRWAICIVRDAENPSLREASCCSVEVVNGADGWRFVRFVSTEETENEDAFICCSICFACSSDVMSSFPTFLESRPTSRAERCLLSSVLNFVSIDQYSFESNASISASLLQINLKATDCTRPADFAPGNLRHNTGERLKPTK